MRLIPGKTKVQIELFKGISIWDIVIGAVGIGMVIAVLLSSIPHRFYIIIGVVFLFVALIVRLDSTPNYVYLLHILRHYSYKRHFERVLDDDTLLVMSGEKSRDGVMDELFGGKGKKKKQAKQPDNKSQQVTKEQRKAEAALYKEESRKLKDKKTTEEEKNEIWKARAQRSAEKKKTRAIQKSNNQDSHPMDDIIPYTGIDEGRINYGGKYYGAVIEIPSVEFRFFSQHRRNISIEAGVGKVLRSINPDYSANIVKIERPINYDRYLEKEYEKLDELRHSFESGLINEQELQARVEVLYDRINELNDLCHDNPVIAPYYYIALFESDKRQLDSQVRNALDSLRYGEIEAKRLDDKELAVFLKYTNEIDFDERMIEKFRKEDYATYAMPQTVDIRPRTVIVNDIQTFNMRITSYPTMVDDAWLATVMSMPATKVVIKCKPMERDKAMRSIDRSLGELRGQLRTTGLDSKALELQEHIASLSELLATLQQENENLLQVNVYVTAYDVAGTRNNPKLKQPPISHRSTFGSMKKAVRRLYQEHGFKLINMEFDQAQAFIGGQISGYDPLPKEARGIPSNSVAAAYPWVFANVSDVGGFKLGSSEGVPVFLNFFRRDSERVNSNMVIVGKSGSGKSYATKDILTNLAAEDAKIFILDPENEYSELANNLHGKFINVGNAQQGRINPFHIITAIDDDTSEGGGVTGSYATHLQFLEEFFRQILPDCDKDALEYLNNLVDRMYTNFGITAETDLSKLTPDDYPIFDDLYDAVLAEFQQTDNEYIRTILRSLMNYIAKFSTGGRNANIWNGPSTITTDENFTVFNFQSLLANRNGTIANAQMLLVLKYVDNEIIKNRDYNIKYHLNRKVVVAIDEAHVFIDTKFPVALDFMFQLAKRIRKYNGMQIVITQNIKDFVGSEEIARKSTAIINACQYSLIFALAPNDMQDLCKLYEKAGGINEMEQEQILMAPRGQAFTVMGPSSRSTFRVEVPDPIVDMFQNDHYESAYFTGVGGPENWENFVGESRTLWEQNRPVRQERTTEPVRATKKVVFTELTEDESQELIKEQANPDSQVLFTEEISQPKKPASSVIFTEETPEPPKSASSVIFTEEPAQTVQDGQSQSMDEVQNVPPMTDAQGNAQQPTELERLLTQALGQFSHAAMIEQIKQAVHDEVQRNLSAVESAQMSGLSSNVSKMPDTSDISDDFDFDKVDELDSHDDTEFSIPDELDSHDDAEFNIPDEFDESDSYDNLYPDIDDNEDTDESTDDNESDDVDDASIFNSFLDFDNDSDEESEDNDDYDDYDSEQDAKDDDEEDHDYDSDDYDDSDDDSDDDDSDDDDMDIFSLLMEQANEMESINPIDMMEVYDENVIDITLEELAAYIAKNR